MGREGARIARSTRSQPARYKVAARALEGLEEAAGVAGRMLGRIG